MDTRSNSGIFPALLTPFDGAGRINEAELGRLVRHHIRQGVEGFYVTGSTAEAFFLTTEERKQIMRTVRHHAPSQRLIAHIGAMDERAAVELGLYARELGYDAVSSVAPFYYKFTFDEIRDYYFRLADKTGMPMLVYHFPGNSGVNMSVDEMSVFLEDDRFIGMKFTSNDFFALEQCKAQFPGKVIYNGFDEMFLAGLSMGADGGVGSTYNFMADKFVAIRQLFLQGNIPEAQKLQKEANRIIRLLFKVGLMKAQKEIMNLIGFDFGTCRTPFSAPTAADKEFIRREIVPYLQKAE
ncbi:MAG: N-acetylneuraminate lyase [Clostridia bacterium]|nr:N-acetylneuraminate lyase [Clostridia bacterium]